MSEPIQSISQGNYILHNIDAKKLYVQEPLFTANSGDAVYVGWRPDETVLWEGTDPLDQSCLVNGTRETATLSEPLSSFDRIRIYAVWNPWIGNFTGCNTFEYPGTNTKGGYIMNDCTNQGFIAGGSWSANETTFRLVKHWQANYPAAKETSDGLGGIFKVVGINRKENA